MTSKTGIILRDYQEKALSALNIWFKTNPTGNPLIEAPTGSGKSIMIAEFVRRAMKYKGVRILMLTHVKELIQQNTEELESLCPGLDIGIYSAGMNRRDVSNRIIYAGIQSVYKRAEELGRFDIILIDEADLVPMEGEGRYRTFIKAAKEINPRIRIVGFTATPYRLSGGYLYQGEGRIFTDVAYKVSIKKLVKDGWLCPLTTKRTENEIDSSGVTIKMGEFNMKELSEVVNSETIVKAACKEIIRRGKDRKSWMIFCVDVKHAMQVMDCMNDLGIPTGIVTGDTDKLERSETIKKFKSHKLRALVNVNVLSRGFNAPYTDMLAILRPTQSTSWHVQALGRGMRTAPGKDNCIAEGELVLTNRGLVPIEQVKIDDLLWDGEEWVAHQGVVSKGLQSVISYAGLTATEDHNVWTEEGWKTFGECAREQVPISVTGDGRTAIRERDGHRRRGSPKREDASSIFDDSLQRVRQGGAEGSRHTKEGDCRMQKMWASKIGAEMVSEPLHCCKAEMHKSKGSKVQGLRWTGDRVQFLGANSDGCLDHRKSRSGSISSDRQNRQQWELRTWKLEAINRESEPNEYEGASRDSRDACVQDEVSRRAILGQYSGSDDLEWDDIRGDRQEMGSPIVQTERRVWDILNAGPRHRFTVEGLLVSNCLVLDFAGNIDRHGPVDMVQPRSARDRKSKDGGGLTKTCNECQEIVHLSCRQCPSCGFMFPERTLKHSANPTSAAAMSLEDEDRELTVQKVWYSRHKKKGKPDSLRVEYDCGFRQCYNEWVCFEHGGYARKKAVEWWLLHVGSEVECPETVTEALEDSDTGMFLEPRQIVVRKDGEWDRIVEKRNMHRPADDRKPGGFQSMDNMDEGEIPF